MTGALSGRMIVMVNHFTSKGSDPTGMDRRIFQADRVKDIVAQRREQGFNDIVVCGDFNDTPASPSLANLMAAPGLTDVVKKFADKIDATGKRLGTYETGKQQIDYLMMSDSISSKARSAGIERRGYFAPRTFKSFETVKSDRDQASDHHCVWVDLAV